LRLTAVNRKLPIEAATGKGRALFEAPPKDILGYALLLVILVFCGHHGDCGIALRHIEPRLGHFLVLEFLAKIDGVRHPGQM
jgi:hypothetical protein